MRTAKTLAVLVVLLIAGCGMELKPTPEKAYKDEIAKMKVVKEHQILQLEIMKINAAIDQMKAMADAKMPNYQLAPETKRPSHKIPDPNE